MDNLNVSAKFMRCAWVCDNEVMISCVVKKSGKGVPACILQEEKRGNLKRLERNGR